MDRNTDHAGKQMKIYIIRHGETDMNARAVMQGWMDEPLNAGGRDLAVITGRAMRGIHFDGCFHLGRAIAVLQFGYPFCISLCESCL